MTPKRMKVYKDEAGEWRWTLWSSSDRVATSGEGYTNRGYAVKAALDFTSGADIDLEVDGAEDDA